MRFVLRGEDFPTLPLRLHCLQTGLALDAIDLLDVIPLGLLSVLLALAGSFLLPQELSPEFLLRLSRLDVPDHAVKVSEERLGVIVHVVLLLSVHSQVVCLLKQRFVQIRGLTVQVLHVELHHHFGNVFVHLLNEGSDRLGLRVQLVEASQEGQQLDELVVNFPLVLGLPLLLGDFPFKDPQELWLEKHFMESDEYFEDEFQDFRKGVLEPDSVRDGGLVADEFVLVKVDQVAQLLVDDLELLPDKLLEQEDIPVLVYIIEPVDVRTDGPPQLPSVRCL